MKKETDNKYDSFIDNLKNKKIVIVFLLFFVILVGVSKSIDAIRNIYNVIPVKKNVVDSVTKKIFLDSIYKIQPEENNSSIEKGDDLVEVIKNKYSVFVYVNSDNINSDIHVDAKRAEVISGFNSTIKEVLVESEKIHIFTVVDRNGKAQCFKSVNISSNKQKVYPCLN